MTYTELTFSTLHQFCQQGKAKLIVVDQQVHDWWTGIFAGITVQVKYFLII